jgi:hypothetical protein
MPDEQNRIAEDIAAPGSAVRQFHVGNTPQVVPPELNKAEEQSLEARSQLLKVPAPRPPFGTDEDGNPRPDPGLVPAEAPEPRASRAGPTPEPRTEPKPEPKR